MLLQLLAVAAVSAVAPGAAGPRANPVAFTAEAVEVTATDTVSKRRHAIEYSDAYYTRLQIHRIASYAELPLFAAEYVLGERLIKDERTGFPPQSLKTAHNAVALGLGALFAVNTVTGGWNLWDSRQDPSGRTLRVLHSVLMLGADAGFALAGATGSGANESIANTNHHRAVAVASMGVAAVGTAIMWLRRD